MLKNEPLEQMGDDMFNFIQDLHAKQKAKANEEKEAKKIKREKKEKTSKKLMIENNKEHVSVEKETAYHITEEECIQIVDKLPKETFTDFNKWCSFTTMCKILNFKNVWDEINKTKPKYNEKNNQKIWKTIDIKYEGRIDDVLGIKEAKLFRDMFKYKKEPINTIESKETFHRNKIGYDYLQDAGH